MRFVLMTDKTTNQCMKALHERLQANETKTRPALDGWIEKSGRFSISISRQVVGKFSRRTRLRGTAERESGTTIVRGFVPEGVNRTWLMVIGAVIVMLAGYMFLNGQFIVSLAVLFGGAVIIISLWGDHRNHDILLHELEKTLKAKPAPPGTSTLPKKTKRAARSRSR